VQAHNQARAHRVRARDMLLPLLDRFGGKHRLGAGNWPALLHG
jgi:hypothetical protein